MLVTFSINGSTATVFTMLWNTHMHSNISQNLNLKNTVGPIFQSSLQYGTGVSHSNEKKKSEVANPSIPLESSLSFLNNRNNPIQDPKNCKISSIRPRKVLEFPTFRKSSQPLGAHRSLRQKLESLWTTFVMREDLLFIEKVCRLLLLLPVASGPFSTFSSGLWGVGGCAWQDTGSDRR